MMAAAKATPVPTIIIINAQPSVQLPKLYIFDLDPHIDLTSSLFHPTGNTKIPAR